MTRIPRKLKKRLGLKMRYFFVSYLIGRYEGGMPCIGNLFIKKTGFPNNNWLKKRAVNKADFGSIESCVITSLFEFKNKKDFDSFTAN